MFKGGKFSRINFVVNLFLLILLSIGVAQSWVLQDEPASFGNATVGNITVTDGTLSNVVLTTNPAYPTTSRFENTSSINWERAANGSMYASWNLTNQTVNNSKSLGQVHYNSDSATRTVVFSATCNSLGHYLLAQSDGNNPPTTNIIRNMGGNDIDFTPIWFKVLPGNYYRITAPNGGCTTNQIWVEYI